MYIRLKPVQIISIHNQEITNNGGTFGIKNLDLLRTLCEKPFIEPIDSIQYRDLFERAAVYLYEFSKAECFLEKNKSTALIITLTFIYLNGYELRADIETVYQLMLEVDTEQVNVNHIAQFFRTYCRKIK